MIFRKEYDNANIATLVQRKSRYTVLFRNNDRQSKPIIGRLINELSPLLHSARQGITFDRGFEFVSWRDLETGLRLVRDNKSLSLPRNRICHAPTLRSISVNAIRSRGGDLLV